jgi:hypothetical protein
VWAAPPPGSIPSPPAVAVPALQLAGLALAFALFVGTAVAACWVGLRTLVLASLRTEEFGPLASPRQTIFGGTAAAILAVAAIVFGVWLIRRLRSVPANARRGACLLLGGILGLALAVILHAAVLELAGHVHGHRCLDELGTLATCPSALR